MHISEAHDCEKLKRIGKRIGDARDLKSLTLIQLANRANLDEKTVRTAISGHYVKPSSLTAICRALNIDLEEENLSAGIASEVLGGYNIEHYRDYLGCFIGYRRIFAQPELILRSIYRFSWQNDKGKQGLFFEEFQKYQPTASRRTIDYSQNGDIYISNNTGILQLLTVCKGALRLVSLTKMHGYEKIMCGIVLTQAQQSVFHRPSTSAIFLRKTSALHIDDSVLSDVGPIGSEHSDYTDANDMLVEVENNIGIFALTKDGPSQLYRSVKNENHASAAASRPLEG